MDPGNAFALVQIRFHNNINVQPTNWHLIYVYTTDYTSYLKEFEMTKSTVSKTNMFVSIIS